MKFEDCINKKLVRKHSFPPETVRKELSNARKHLNNAERNFEYEMLDIAIMSSYTSMFHACRALLFRDGFKERSHICLVAFLRDRYPNMNELASMLDIYRTNRHESLYGIDYRPIAEDANIGISSAKMFIKAVEDELKQDHYDEDP